MTIPQEPNPKPFDPFVVAGPLVIVAVVAVFASFYKDRPAAFLIAAGTVIVTATDSAAYTVLVDGDPVTSAGSEVRQPIATTSKYELRSPKVPNFCPLSVTIDYPYKRVCIRCDAKSRIASEVACRSGAPRP